MSNLIIKPLHKKLLDGFLSYKEKDWNISLSSSMTYPKLSTQEG